MTTNPTSTPILALCDAATKVLQNGQPVWGAGLDAYNKRLSPEVVRAVWHALDSARCTVHNALEAERTSEAPITEQCLVFIDTRKQLINALALLDGLNPEAK